MLQRIDIPDWAWRRPEIQKALASRDIGILFETARQYGGASQARIAAAVGISQPRVNEIMKRRRMVSSIDVLERIAAGLWMPDDARMTLGLAPRNTDLTHTHVSHEITQVFPNQQSIVSQLRHRALDANELDILAVRGLGIIGLNDSMFLSPLTARVTPLHLRVLLLNPESDAAVTRAAEIGESVVSFRAGIALALAKLHEISESHPLTAVEVKLYDRLPIWRLFRLDDVMYISTFADHWEGHESIMYEIPRSKTCALSMGYQRTFDDLWNVSPWAFGES